MEKYRKFILNLILFLLFSTNGKAQAIFSNPIGSWYSESNLGLNIGTLFNHQDFLLDMGLGYDDTGLDLSVSINALFRPYYKTGLLEISDHYFYQVKEKVIEFSIDLEKRFYFIQFIDGGKFGLYASLKSGYFWGSYKGLKKNRNNQFAFNPGGGLSWQFPNVARIYLGYMYFNQNSFASANMIQVKVGFWLGKNIDSD